MDSFFNALERSVDRNTILEFKNAPKDSALIYFYGFKNEVFKLYYDSTQSIALDSFFNNTQIRPDDQEAKICFLCFAFHSKLNFDKYNFDKIAQNCDEEFFKIKEKWDKKRSLFQIEQYAIMQNNDKRWTKGDFININLPVRFEKNLQSACYCRHHPSSIDCSNFEDSLRIYGMLLKKRYYTQFYLDKTDTLDVDFELKILKLSNAKYDIFGKKYHIGDTLSISLSSYGKPMI